MSKIDPSTPPCDKQICMTEYELKKIIENTVNTTLIQLGIDHDDPLEMQRDFMHLREWRQSMERMKNKSMATAIGIVIAGFCAALWMGFKHLISS